MQINTLFEHPIKSQLSKLSNKQLYSYCAELRHQDGLVDEILWERKQKELEENPCIELYCWTKGVFGNHTILKAKDTCKSFIKCKTIFDIVRNIEYSSESCLDGSTKEIVRVDGIICGLFDEINISKPHKINIEIL